MNMLSGGNRKLSLLRSAIMKGCLERITLLV